MTLTGALALVLLSVALIATRLELRALRRRLDALERPSPKP